MYIGPGRGNNEMNMTPDIEFMNEKYDSNVLVDVRPMNHKLVSLGFDPAMVDTEQHTIIATVSTDGVDRDNEVVMTSGLNIDNVQPGKNGVVLYMHDAYTVIAKILWIKKTKHTVIAKVKFANTEFANEVFELYAGGFMRGWSIGMDGASIQRHQPSPAELKKHPSWAHARWILDRADMLELSAVSIPANADALNKAYDNGMVKHTRPMFERWLKNVKQSMNTVDRVVVEPVRNVDVRSVDVRDIES